MAVDTEALSTLFQQVHEQLSVIVAQTNRWQRAEETEADLTWPDISDTTRDTVLARIIIQANASVIRAAGAIIADVERYNENHPTT